MKVNVNTPKQNEVRKDQLKVGDVFSWGDQVQWYMRGRYMGNDTPCYINLHTGVVHTLSDLAPNHAVVLAKSSEINIEV